MPEAHNEKEIVHIIVVSGIRVAKNVAYMEHTWEHHHPIHWEETTILDHGRGQELLVKEALHIQMTPVEERFN